MNNKHKIICCNSRRIRIYGNAIHISEVRSEYTLYYMCVWEVYRAVLASGTDLRVCGMHKLHSSTHTYTTL